MLDETYRMVDLLHNGCRFFAHESCGQCTPCREGTHWALQMLERIKAGRGRLKDLDLLLEIGDSIGIIPGTTICGLADGAAWPIKTVHPQVPRRVRGLHQAHQSARLHGDEPVEAVAATEARMTGLTTDSLIHQPLATIH